MKFIKSFETQAMYEALKPNLILPNVSLIKENMSVSYTPWIDPYRGHDYVEIGGKKWATMNIGASTITDAGKYFQWGDVSGYTASQVGTDKVFDWANYKYCDGTYSVMTKYNTTDGKKVLDAVDDAAAANWGGVWKMPTTAEFQALGTATTSAWTADYEGSGVAGLVCTDKTDSSKVLFFPAVGDCDASSIGGVGRAGSYWSSSLDYTSRAYRLLLTNTNINYNSTAARIYGFSIRPVAD